MSGYRGDGFGQYGNVGDDEFRFGDGRLDERPRRDRSDREPEHGAAHGNLLGCAERDTRAFFQGRDEQRIADNPDATRAADDWNRRFGREGYEGSYAQDDDYHRYRQQHLAELDRDYDEWCSEREHDFHRDFNDWRSQRRQVSNQPGDQQAIGGDMEADQLVSSGASEAPKPRRTRR